MNCPECETTGRTCWGCRLEYEEDQRREESDARHALRRRSLIRTNHSSTPGAVVDRVGFRGRMEERRNER